MMGSRRRVEDFNVDEFLRSDDQDMQSAITSLLRDEPPAVSHPVQREGGPDKEGPVPFSAEVRGKNLTVARPKRSAKKSADSAGVVAGQKQIITRGGPPRAVRRGITPVSKSFNLTHYIKRAKTLYRLNKTEVLLYEMLLKWTHAVGETRCAATNRRFRDENDQKNKNLTDKLVRRNLKSLKERSLIIQIKPYDPYTHEAAVYEVILPEILIAS